MADVTLTSPNPVIDTRPDKKESLLPSVQDYYERFRNPNLFISNNANPFLISPYAPNQLSQTTKNTILATDLIKPFTPNKTIVVEGSMMAEAPNYFLTGTNKPLLHDTIYASNYPESATLATCLPGPTPGFIISMKSAGPSLIERMIMQPNDVLFTNSANTFSVKVEGKVVIDSGALPNPIELTTTTLGAAAPVTLQGYMPMLVNGGQVYVPFYSSP